MKRKAKTTQNRGDPLKLPMKFDEAIERALQVKLPPEGWKEYGRLLKKEKSAPEPLSGA
jgi:hypothetical protein